MCTPRNWKLDTLSTLVDADGLQLGLPPSEVEYQLLRLGGIDGL